MSFFGLGRLFGGNNSNSSNDDLIAYKPLSANNIAAENARRAANARKAANREEQYAEIARLKAEANRAEENSKRARAVASKIHDGDEIFVMDTVPENNETQDGGRRKLKSKTRKSKSKSRKSKSKSAKSKKSPKPNPN